MKQFHQHPLKNYRFFEYIGKNSIIFNAFALGVGGMLSATCTLVIEH